MEWRVGARECIIECYVMLEGVSKWLKILAECELLWAALQFWILHKQ
jgi:hypothetical protein